MAHQLEKEIDSDIGHLIERLVELGYEPTGSLYDAKSFGNYYVDLSSGKTRLRIVRDRSQYYVEGSSTEQLRRAGMFRAFDDRSAFERALLDWLRAA